MRTFSITCWLRLASLQYEAAYVAILDGLAADHNCKSLTSLLLRPKIFLCSCHTFQWSTSTLCRSQNTAVILWALQPGAPFRLVVHRLWATSQEAEFRIVPNC